MKGSLRPGKIWRPVLWVLAIAYFLIDAISASLLKPLRQWLDKLDAFRRMAGWIRSLGPYSSLFIFLVPLIVLEPVKPVALYLMGIGQFFAGLVVLVVGEALKIRLIERLFRLTCPKLMSFRLFAWAYNWVIEIFAYFRSFEVWKSARRWFEDVRAFARRSLEDIKAFARRAVRHQRLVLRRQQARR